MRQLMRRLRHGMTLVELMAGLAVTAILLGMAGPYLADTVANGQLREAGNALLGETLHAQAEAIKRNASTRLVVRGSLLEVRSMAQGEPGVLLRQRQLSHGVAVTANLQIDFNSRGAVLPLGTDAAADLTKPGLICSAELRCPGLRVDGGGGVRLCPDQLRCS